MEKRVYQVITADLSAGDLTLEAKYGQGFEVIELGVNSGGAGQIIDVILGGEKMLSLPVTTTKEHLAPLFPLDINPNTLFKTIRNAYPDVPTLKVSQGETLTIQGISGLAGTCGLIFRELSGDQIPAKTADGASEGKNRLFISHGKALESIAVGSDVIEINSCLNPAGYSKFPFEQVAPVGTEFDLLGMSIRKGDGSGANITLNGFRVWKREESIIAPNEAFTSPLFFPYSDDTGLNFPTFFSKRITFVGNERLLVDAQVTNAGVGAENAEIFVTCIFLMRTI
jgi:hypothetical protein